MGKVLLALLLWPYAWASSKTEFKDAGLIDQIATASENVATVAKRSEPITDRTDTVHYENSNGFVPMTPSPPPVDQNDRFQENSTARYTQILPRTENGNIENDPAYSTEARIFLNLQQGINNRRSFTTQDTQNDFELLRVKNDTPAVANYRDFYENLHAGMNKGSERDSDSKTSQQQKSRDRGKRIESYMSSYGTDDSRDSNVGDPAYGRYYTYGVDRQKTAKEQEKVDGNYRQHGSVNYDGHGHSALIQNAPASSTLPRTNYEANELAADNEAASSSSSSTRTRHQFSKPVVVVEPSDYKVDVKFTGQSSRASVSTAMPYKNTKPYDHSNSATLNNYNAYNGYDSSRSYTHTKSFKDSTDDSMDYSDYTEKPRRLHKSRRKPYSDSSRRLPKEHRGSLDNANSDSLRKRPTYSKAKYQRQRPKPNTWIEDEDSNEESYEEASYIRQSSNINTEVKNSNEQAERLKHGSNVWNQVGPNVEISHSSGVEIDENNKAKYVVPFKINVVPVANFDHATALGNSQGFDMSNAVLQNFVTAGPVSSIGTNGPLLSTPHPTAVPNVQNIGISTPMPDIIVGQNTYQQPVQFVPSTMAPMVAVTPTPESMLQSVHGMQSTATTNANYGPTSTATPVLQQLILPQPTFQSFSNLPIQSNSQYSIQVNPHGLQGQNVISNSNLQAHNFHPMPSSTTTPQPQPVTRVNLVTAESQNKKTYLPGSGRSYLATASFAVEQNGQNFQQSPKFPDFMQKPNVLQATPIIPAIIQTTPAMNHVTFNSHQFTQDQQNRFLFAKPIDQSQQFLNSNIMQQIQLNNHRNQFFKNNRLPSSTYQSIDNTGSSSINNINTVNTFGVPAVMNNAQLPNVGTKNVQILNPNMNLKPSPIDATGINGMNPMQQYQAAIVTTPIPILTTSNTFVTARPVTLSPTTATSNNVQNYVDTLTEIGAKANQDVTFDLRPPVQPQERPMYNPINFVPNTDLINSQTILNSKINSNEPLQPNLNLVPLLPNGNFFKPSFSAQSELINKPKLSSDLQKYAEEMFKESLKTIYNSQKWNNDRRVNGQNNSSESNDLAKLRLELQKLKAALPDLKSNKEILEAHHSENKFRTTEPGRDKKKPDALLQTLEQLLKAHPSEPIHIYHNGKHLYDDKPFSSFKDHKHEGFLTPPLQNSFVSKSPFYDKPHKRPGSHRHGGHAHHHDSHIHHHGSHSHMHASHSHPHHSHHHHHHGHGHGHVSGHGRGRHQHHHHREKHRSSTRARLNGPETSATHIDVGHHSPHFDYLRGKSPFDEEDDFSFENNSPYDGHSFFSHSSSEPEYRKLDHKDIDINHPRMHNLLGLLMKNKQLPLRDNQNYFRDRSEGNPQLDLEKKRNQQFYTDTTKNLALKKSDDSMRPMIKSKKVELPKSYVARTPG